ncbi:MAG TPA: peptide ABC transporter substrate-binding protein [Gemmatimonadaceae bacterium]|nr:peptide ABC transporter substrate-binding protein [Gemmatimonadaceae bacterium]
MRTFIRPFSLLAIAAGTLVSACSSKEAPVSAGATGGTVVINAPTDPTTLFPPLVSEEVGRWIEDLVFDRLAQIGPDMSTVGDKGFTPELAKSWTWAPDSLSIAFSIDPRARWHDGQPVTARDVQYSFQLFTDPKVGSSTASTLSNVDSVSVRDSLTAVFWFKKRTPEQFYDAVYQVLVMPEHVYGKVPMDQLRTSEVTRTPVGSGRFRFSKWDVGQRIELLADTANYRGRAKLDRVLIVPADPPTQVTRVLTGQADVMEAFPSDQNATLDSSKVAGPVLWPTLGYAFMGMNLHAGKTSAPHPIFGDVRVRRAFSMAVDRGAMLQNIFGKLGLLGHGPFAAAFALADTTIPVPPFDTVAAKALLDSAGWREPSPGAIRVKNGKPLRFTLMTPSSSVPRRQYAVLIQAALRRIGAQADIQIADPRSVMYPKMDAGDFDAVINALNPDPSITGTVQSWGTSGAPPNGQNYMRYSNPGVDALLDSAAQTFDAAKAKQYASRAYRDIVADAPAIWLYDYVLVNAVNRRINVAPFRPDGWWVNLPDWTIPQDKRIERDRIGLAPAKP